MPVSAKIYYALTKHHTHSQVGKYSKHTFHSKIPGLLRPIFQAVPRFSRTEAFSGLETFKDFPVLFNPGSAQNLLEIEADSKELTIL